LTCLESAVKRDLLRSLSLPNRISLSSSTNARISTKHPLAMEGVDYTLFFLAKHAGQRRDGANALLPRLRLESKLCVPGVEFNRGKLEEISREHELQVRELAMLGLMEMGATDLNSTKRRFRSSDLASYRFLMKCRSRGAK